MTSFLDMGDDRSLPVPSSDNLPAPQSTEIRTTNGNQGAIRVDVQRNISIVRRRIAEDAEAFGANWVYSIPFKKKIADGGTKTELITGPTITCTMDVARAYGNCDAGCDKVEETKDSWIFHATFLDIETGFRTTRLFRQRRQANIGGMGGDKARAEDIIFQIGASKAVRNVIVKGLGGLVAEAVDRSRNRLTEKIAANIQAWRDRVKERLQELEIPEARINAHYQRPIDALKPAEIAQIARQLQAIQEDVMTADDLCPAVVITPKATVSAPRPVTEDAPDAPDAPGANAPTAPAPEPATEPETKRKRVKLTFRGKEIFKTHFLRDLKQLAADCVELADLIELSKEAQIAVGTIADDQDRTTLVDEVAALMRKNFDEFDGIGEEAEPEAEGMPEEENGETLSNNDFTDLA